MAASIKTLTDAFAAQLAKEPGDPTETIQALRFALQSFDNGRSCYRVLRECDLLLRNFGVEVITDEHGHAIAEYSNSGDSYAATIVYSHITSRFYVCGWADWYETSDAYKRYSDAQYAADHE